ncbi:pilus assembly PilX N-terminal domain-containing protein [Alkalibacterium pelagium]|uniref:DUF7305 domain-containing protein n=1 Tax=Alkalibacterium pelagium TaxID=426702 RepID=A0A1H7KTU3_9LACT|nr:pilus assembly PilX N-terminal domain-containing protein [Alkalibacterium pelagium]GEN50648.1 hypothetical protein APE02nite_13130 [Alkalibacterium pelagium]SEK90178.1 hypothetical protein SAMN04488099_10841 [Alkalibacterium pelagium]
MLTKFKNEDGSGLILALMTLMVLSVLGAALGAITIGGYRLSSVNRDTTSAYYIAEAGVNQAYEEIEELVIENQNESRSHFFSKIDNHKYKDGITLENFQSQFNTSPVSKVTLKHVGEEGDTKSYILQSEGNVDGRKRLVEKTFDVTWTDNSPGVTFPVIPEGASLIANSYMYISGNELVGNVVINTTQNESVSLTYTNVSKATFLYSPGADPARIINFPDWNRPNRRAMDSPVVWSNFTNVVSDFPEIPVFSPPIGNKNLRLNGGVPPTVIDLKEDTSYETIELNSERVLRFDVGDKDLRITVNELLMNNGHIEIVGEGSLTIFVKNKMPFGSSSTLNRNAHQSKLSLYYAGASALNFSGAQRINGSIHIKQADINVQGGAGINGVIFTAGKKVYFDGGTFSSPLIFAPNANVELIAGANFEGIILGERISMDGGAIVKYKPYDFSAFPFASNDSGNGSSGSSKELISSDPISETR